ncbi:hypothetical protein [Aureivirga sp. CE67]|uniref:hypothetical protein n=1 Tax=Aureivirga sp. CE67 TaxID=1788983 RepID=UPI0018C969FF|nr:hypothetical protein [Aureivirga sp. CE67]
MNHPNKSLIKLFLIFFGALILQSCKTNKSQDELENIFIKNEVFTRNKSFLIKSFQEKYTFLNNENNTFNCGRFNYSLEIDFINETVLLDGVVTDLDNLTKVLEKEFLTLIENFKDYHINDYPDVGFNLTYLNNNEKNKPKKMSEIISVISKSVSKIGKTNTIDQNKIAKLLQLKFYFFPVDSFDIKMPPPPATEITKKYN